MAETTARSKTVPEAVSSGIAANTLIDALQKYHTRVQTEAHENNTGLLVKRELRNIEAHIRQFAELHGLEP